MRRACFLASFCFVHHIELVHSSAQQKDNHKRLIRFLIFLVKWVAVSAWIRGFGHCLWLTYLAVTYFMPNAWIAGLE